MKIKNCLKAVLLAASLTLVACHSSKSVVKETPGVVSTLERTELIGRVVDHAQKNTPYIGSKLKFAIDVGKQQLSVSGTLRMKRDDVIRLQLMALGLVEAARLEFTRDSVLIMDRINKQYLKAPYDDVDFLRDSGINFHMLQALFWNELFLPGQTEVSASSLSEFSVGSIDSNEATINYEDSDASGVKSRMLYSWLVSIATGSIKTTNVMYRDKSHGNTQLNWEYSDFKEMKSKLFPCDMQVHLATPKKDIKISMKLSSLNNDSGWETRTKVSSKYSKVDVDNILRRVMSL